MKFPGKIYGYVLQIIIHIIVAIVCCNHKEMYPLTFERKAIIMKKNETGMTLLTVEDAVNEIKSGDTVWVGSASSISTDFLDALSARQGELENVTILAEKGSLPCAILDELKYKSTFRVMSFFTEALSQTYAKGNKAAFFKFTAPKTIEAVCREFGVNTVAITVCQPDTDGNVNLGKAGNFVTPLINSYAGVTKRIAILDQTLDAADEHETKLALSDFDVVCQRNKASRDSHCA